MEGYTAWYTAVPNITKMHAGAMEGRERQRSKLFFHFFLITINFYLIFIPFYLFWGKHYKRKGRIWRNWEMSGIGLRNSQGINKNLKTYINSWPLIASMLLFISPKQTRWPTRMFSQSNTSGYSSEHALVYAEILSWQCSHQLNPPVLTYKTDSYWKKFWDYWVYSSGYLFSTFNTL